MITWKVVILTILKASQNIFDKILFYCFTFFCPPYLYFSSLSSFFFFPFSLFSLFSPLLPPGQSESQSAAWYELCSPSYWNKRLIQSAAWYLGRPLYWNEQLTKSATAILKLSNLHFLGYLTRWSNCHQAWRFRRIRIRGWKYSINRWAKEYIFFSHTF